MRQAGMALLALVAAVAGHEPKAEPMNNTTLRILTFNIKHGSTMKGDFDLERIAGVIRDAKPDLVALQEVDIRTGRARRLDLATELAQRTKLSPAFAAAMPFDGGEYGVAILSRYSFNRTRRVPLPYTGDNEPRVALSTTLDLPDGTEIRFISTHLDFGSEKERLSQAHKLNAEFAGDGMPAILAGDFNAKPGSSTMEALAAHWTATCGPEAAPTFPSEHPRIKIDYVLFRPEGRWRVKETRVITDKLASDHCAYLAVLELASE